MSTTIEWTQRPGTKGETWNPVVGCTKVSQGCKNCYAKAIHDNRHKAFNAGKLQNVKQYAVPFEHVQLMPDRLTMPLRWKSPRTIFVNSVSDLFHESVPFSYVDQVFAVMALTPQHTYQILTKRPERMAEYLLGRQGAPTYVHDFDGQHIQADGALPNNLRAVHAWSAYQQQPFQRVYNGGWYLNVLADVLSWPLPNVWLGTSVEDQATADARIIHLLCCPAAVRFLSCEPLLGNVKLGGYYNIPWAPGIDTWNDGIHWVIAGGESGAKARPMHPDWVRSLRDQCKAAGVPFFFKQWGEWVPCPIHVYNVLNEGNRSFWGEPAGLDGWRGGHLPRMLEDILNDNASSVEFTTMHKMGKHKSGRLLDGVEHSAWPC